MYIKEYIDIRKLADINYNQIERMCHSYCHCISIETDLCSYIMIDGHPECVPKLKTIIREYVDDVPDVKIED